MSRFQVSKFRNIELNSGASFGDIPKCSINEWNSFGNNSQLIVTSGTCLASYIGSDKVTITSSLPTHDHLLDIHCPSISDLSFSPFYDDLLAITSQDNHVNLYRLPIQLTAQNEFISKETYAQNIAKISVENSKVQYSRFHSLIPDILAQASDNSLMFHKLDVSSQDYSTIYSNQYTDSEKLLTFAFSEASLDYAVLKENSGLFLSDIRTNSIVQQTDFKTTSKNFPSVGFLENCGPPCLLSTSDNFVQIWDRRSFSSPISSIHAQNDSKLMLLIDHDTGLIFFVSYNSGLVLVCEEKQLLSGNGFNNAYSSYVHEKFRSTALASKRILQYDVPEVNRLYGLTSSKIVPMQFIVPRKVQQTFFGDYFSPTKSPFNQKCWEEICSSEDSFKVAKINLHPQVNRFVDRFSLLIKPDNLPQEDNEENSLKISDDTQVSHSFIKNEQFALQNDKTDGNITPKCKFLRGSVDLKRKIEFKEEVYDALASMRLLKIGKNLAVMPLGRNACDTLALINLTNGELQTFKTTSLITDYVVDPFLEEGGQLICVGTNSGDVYLIDVNFNQQQMNISSSHLPDCHQATISKVLFHPLFANTLLTVGKEDNLVQIWSVTSERKLNNLCSQSLVTGSDTIFDACWSKFKNGGNRLAVLVKTKDNIEKIIIYEYFECTFKMIHELSLPKFCFMISLEWIIRDEFILATGRYRGDMKLLIWDSVENYRQIVDITVDSNPYSLYSYLDEDTGTLLLIPKGDRQIYIYGLQFEEDTRTLQLQRFDPFQTSTRVLGCSFGQKINCDVMKMEIANGFILSDAFIAPFSLVVPRKNMINFDDNLFPTTIPYWKSQFKELFEVNDPSSYNCLQRVSLQPKGYACASQVSDSNRNNNNSNSNEKIYITMNQAINDPYLAMKVKDQIETSLSTMISNFVVEDENIGRGKQNYNNDSEEENDWD